MLSLEVDCLPARAIDPTALAQDDATLRDLIQATGHSTTTFIRLNPVIRLCSMTFLSSTPSMIQVPFTVSIPCSSYGPDWSNLPNGTSNVVSGTPINATYQFGTGNEGGMSPSYVRLLSRHIRQYLANGYGTTNNSAILFARAGKTSVGLYMGKGLQNEATSQFALTSFESAVACAAQGTGTVAMQLCQPGNDGDHVFGIISTSNSTFQPIQDAIQSWSNAECRLFSNATNITGPAYFITLLILNLPEAQTKKVVEQDFIIRVKLHL